MASDVNQYKCEACTGPLRYDEESGKLVCDYCGTSYDLKEIETKVNKEETAPKKKRRTPAKKTEGRLSSYSCESCGAELICDDTTIASSCPYCGNPMVMTGAFTGKFKPELVIPFKLNKEEAKEGLLKFYKGKKFLPDSFSDMNHIDEIKGVYVPFWLYDSVADGKMVYSGEKQKTYTKGDTEYTETFYYDINRSGNISFEKIPFDSSSKMPDEYMDAIEPFDYSELVPFSQSYLPGFMADRYDVAMAEGKKKADERAKKTLKDMISGSVSGYMNLSTKSETMKVTGMKVHYALMPVWLLSTSWEDKSYLFAMNGQTGKFVGDLPVDKIKFRNMLLKIAGIVGGVTAFFWLCFALL